MDFIHYVILAIVIIILIRKYCNGPRTDYARDMTGKIVVITGATAGIGKETAKDLLRNNATVIFASRDKKKFDQIIKDASFKNDSRSRAVFIPLELTSFKSVMSFYQTLKEKYERIDILINNAGAFTNKFLLTEDNLESTIQINYLSHALLTMLLMELLIKSDDARIINVGSSAHSHAKYSEDYFKFDQTGYSMGQGYANSKIAINFITIALSDFCAKYNLPIKCVVVHPGLVNTEISRPSIRPLIMKILFYTLINPLMYLFAKSEYIGAQTTLHVCYLPRNELIDGGYYADCSLQKLMKQKINEMYQSKFDKFTYTAIVNSKIIHNEMSQNFLDFLSTL